MSLTDKIQAGLLIVMFVGLVFSLLLWLTTRRSLKEIHRQNENIARSIRIDTIHKITQSHQNIFLSLLNNPVLASELTKGMAVGEKFIGQMIGTALINHCSAVHLFALQQTLDSDDWIGIQNDIADLFSWPVVRERWPEIRTFYSKKFQNFIETVVIKGRRVQVKSSGL